MRGRSWFAQMREMATLNRDCLVYSDDLVFLLNAAEQPACDLAAALLSRDAVVKELHSAESIARRALVAGLAECERLRGMLLAAFPPDKYINNEPYWFVGGFRLRIRDGHPFSVLDEQAIRADAARAERERVVKAIADHFATLADDLNHRRVVHGNSVVCERREGAFHEVAGIVRATDWAAIERGDHRKGVDREG